MKRLILATTIAMMSIMPAQAAKKCGDFSSHAQAQAHYVKLKKANKTGWKSLDRNKDGVACECLKTKTCSTGKKSSKKTLKKTSSKVTSKNIVEKTSSKVSKSKSKLNKANTNKKIGQKATNKKLNSKVSKPTVKANPSKLSKSKNITKKNTVKNKGL